MANDRLRVHVLGQAHVLLSESKQVECPYTQRILRFLQLLRDDIDFLYYGVEGSHVRDVQIIPVVPYSVYESNRSNVLDAGYTQTGFYRASEKSLMAWNVMWLKGLNELTRRLTPQDIVVVGHMFHKNTFRGIITPARGFYRDTPVVEFGVQYYKPFTRYRIWDSAAVRHYAHGLRDDPFPNPIDTVIPPIIPIDEIDPYLDERRLYLLYMGPIQEGHGLPLAARIAEQCDMKLILAGEKITDKVNPTIRRLVELDWVVYIGPVSGAKRTKLIQQARAVMCLTEYIEPSATFALEAMAHGTPVISTDYGAYVDYVVDGLTGFRIRSVDDGIDAVHDAISINPIICRRYVERLCDPRRLREQYLEFFHRLLTCATYFKEDALKLIEDHKKLQHVNWSDIVDA